MSSDENFMNPGVIFNELKGMSVVEPQLISRISPMHIHMLRHGGIASSGHRITSHKMSMNLPKFFLDYLM